MLARVIIEQRIKDLELAFARQEELLQSQREVLRGLKELIKAEISKADAISLETDSSKVDTPPPKSRSHGSTLTRDVAVSTTQSAPPPPPPPQPQPQPQPPTTTTATAISDSAKKRSRESSAMEPKDAHSNGNPAKAARVQGGSLSASLSAVLNNSKRKRSLDKVNQFCAQLPPVLPVAWTISGGKTISISLPPSDPVKASAAIDRPSTAPNPFKFSSAGSERASPIATSSVAGKIRMIPAQKASSDSDSPASHSSPTLPPSAVPAQVTSSSFPPASLPPAMEPQPRPESVAVSPPPPKLVSSQEAPKGPSVSTMLAVCNRCSTLYTRTDALKQLALLSNPKDIKQFIDSGGREILLDWLSSLDSEVAMDGRISAFLENCLKLLKQGTWTKQRVAQTRVDKVLRRLYKRYIAYPQVLHASLAELLKQMWSQYRYAYNQCKGTAAHEEDDGDMAPAHDPAQTSLVVEEDEAVEAPPLHAPAIV